MDVSIVAVVVLCKIYSSPLPTHHAVFGEGLSGKATYFFELVFCEPVNTEVVLSNFFLNYSSSAFFYFFQHCRVKFSENEIEFRIVKKEGIFWSFFVTVVYALMNLFSEKFVLNYFHVEESF